MIPAPLLAAVVFGDGNDAERLVRALVRRAKAAREHERGAAGRATERSALAVRDPRVVVARGLLADLRGGDRLGGIDATAFGVEQVELRRLARIELRVVGRAGERILLRELDELERIADEALDARFGEVARRRGRDLPALHHAQTGGAMRRFLDELGLAEPNARRQLGARAQEALGDGRTTLRRHGDDAFSELDELGQLGVCARCHAGASLAHRAPAPPLAVPGMRRATSEPRVVAS